MIALFLTECQGGDEHATAKALAELGFRKCFGSCAVLEHAPSGKPCFPTAPGIYVSISHSRGMCLAAIADCEIGADIERTAPYNERIQRVVGRFFAPDEAKSVKDGPDTEFYRLWCRKESYVKYTGEGFSRSFSSFSVLKLQESEGTPIFTDMNCAGFAISVCADEKADTPPVFIKDLQINN